MAILTVAWAWAVAVLWLYSLWRTMSEHEIWKRCARSVRLKTLLLSSMKLLLVR